MSKLRCEDGLRGESMNIEFDNEMIETLIKDEVNRQVREWFRNHNNYIRDTTKVFIQGMVEEITDCIGYNIANYFKERYDL